MNIEEIVDEAIKEYNKYRVPEVEAKLVSFQDESLIIRFSGSFCKTCGYYDYFDDFRFLLEHEYGLTAEIQQIQETSEGGVVEFAVS
ncbi:MAG: hypothetical protein R6V83_12185 [Candidatus Thorarchaeota archaeon]